MANNRLTNETSPYLLQHAQNPVDWYPWGEDALNQAKQKDKPILLSIGYSACHWCHVMAHESFEDPMIAKIMNELFINIKVDREERPDLDKIYQTAHQLLTRQAGGWPLTIFLTPDNQMPFFSGTYFPPKQRQGMPSFKEVLQAIAEYYHHYKGEITRKNQQLQAIFNELIEEKIDEQTTLNAAPLVRSRQQLFDRFDRISGGFDTAPKFPHPSHIERLLRHWAQSMRAKKEQSTEPEDRLAISMITLSLQKMAHGGIHDQIGGGFYRYAVDAEWRIPHFEKMLYDNALLLSLYADAFAITKIPLFTEIIRQTGDWVLREMQATNGGYYATLDADVEGEEGKFYYWDRNDVKNLLTPEEYRIIALHYGLSNPANFEGHWHLHIAQELNDIAEILQIDIETARSRQQSAKKKLFTAREKRIHPARDEKILTAWNALMIKGMAKAGQRLQHPAFINSAENALTCVRQHLWKNHRLLASYSNKKAYLTAYLDDYVFLMDALLTLLQIRFNTETFNFLITLANTVLNHFYDDQKGGFFFTASDHEALIYRPKPLQDEAIPSGNGIATLVFNQLGHLLDDDRYLTVAKKTLMMAWPSMTSMPLAYDTLLNALEEHLNPPELLILRGDPKELMEWQTIALRGYHPHRLCFSIPLNESLPVSLAKYAVSTNKTTGFFCIGQRCLAPITSLDELLNIV